LKEKTNLCAITQAMTQRTPVIPAQMKNAFHVLFAIIFAPNMRMKMYFEATWP
jgi:hypothetical protein